MAFRLPAETKRRLDTDDRRWPVKYGMRSVATVFALIAMILFATSVGVSINVEGGDDWVDGLPLAPVCLALLYNPLTIWLNVFHRQGKPIHPGWHIAIDLLIWGLALPAMVYSLRDGWFLYWQPVLFEFEGFIPCDEIFNAFSYECNPTIYTLGKIEIAANVFLGFILIIHFILFVYACIATHKWRMARKQAATERRNIELQYHRSPEEHMDKQPPAYSLSAQETAKSPVSRMNDEEMVAKFEEATGAVKYS